MIETVLMAILASMVYAMSMYLKKHYGQNAEPFDMFKFGATAVVGALVGAMMGYSGVVPTELGVIEQMGMYAGLTAVVQTWLMVAYKFIKP